MNYELIFFLAFILIIGSIFFFVVSNSNKCKKRLDVEYYRAKCLEYEHLLKPDDVNSYHMSVINADKLVDRALKECGFKGKTMGERLKSASSNFGDNNAIWSAHKLRNRISHESDFKPTYNESKLALFGFRKALKDLGAI